jgi:predicted metal-binding membrane protein
VTAAARERAHVRLRVLFAAACAWLVLLVESGAGGAHHPGGAPVGPAVTWLLMATAMMLPLLTAPLRHVRARSFARRRTRSVALFLAAYLAVWAAAGVPLVGVSVLGPRSGATALLVAVAVVVTWQCSPAKQRCLNRLHAHPPLAAFGTAADLAALRFGVTHALWCVGSCWALMLLPLLVGSGHLGVMCAAALWLAAERLDDPQPLRWRLRGPGKVVRLVVAHLRLHLARSPARGEVMVRES